MLDYSDVHTHVHTSVRSVAAAAAAFEVAVLSMYTIELAAFEARARAFNTWLNMRVRAILRRHRQEGRRTKRQYAVQ